MSDPYFHGGCVHGNVAGACDECDARRRAYDAAPAASSGTDASGVYAGCPAEADPEATCWCCWPASAREVTASLRARVAALESALNGLRVVDSAWDGKPCWCEGEPHNAKCWAARAALADPEVNRE